MLRNTMVIKLVVVVVVASHPILLRGHTWNHRDYFKFEGYHDGAAASTRIIIFDSSTTTTAALTGRRSGSRRVVPIVGSGPGQSGLRISEGEWNGNHQVVSSRFFCQPQRSAAAHVGIVQGLIDGRW